MGESTPDAIELECPGCSARFRLRPTKGRLPKGPINCPECATPFDIPSEYRQKDAPKAQVLKSNKSGPRELPDIDPTIDEDSSKTMMGRPMAIDFDDPKSQQKTRAQKVSPVPRSSESADSIPTELDSDPQDFQEADRPPEHTPLPGRTELEETSESVFNNTTKAPWDNEESAGEDQTEEPARSGVNPNIRKTRPNLAVGKDRSKPKLSELLKKVREKKAQGGPLLGPPPKTRKTTSLSDGLDNLFDETADELNFDSEPDENKTTNPNAGKVEELRDSIRPGMASEARGSGYIRIPTNEIMDVLGEGNYRLKVDDVVYEPVDERGLAKLIKGGVLMGAEEIAEQDGDWMPVADHPVVQRLRRKMADQAHLLLAEVAAASPSSKDGPPTEDLDLDELMSDDLMVDDSLDQTSEAPPPIPLPSQSSDTIETGPPAEMTLPGTSSEDIVPDELPDVGEVSELMAQAKADDPLAGDSSEVQSDMPSASTEFPADIGEPASVEPPFQPMPEFTEESGSDEDGLLADETYPAITQEQSPASGAGAPLAEELEAPAPRKSSAGTGLLITVFGFVFVVGIIVAAYSMGALDPLLGTDEAANNPEPAGNDPIAAVEPDAAESEKPEAPEPEPDPLEEARSVWEAEPSAENAKPFAMLLIDNGSHAEARDVLASSEMNPELRELFNQSLEREFSEEAPVELEARAFEGARAVKLRKRTILIFEHEGKQARFIPDTGASIPAWRASIASYRLCEAALCGFKIPKVIPARIAQSAWEEALVSLDANARTSFTDVDGTSYLMGAIQYEVDTAAFFPVYETEIWREWLNGDQSGLDEALGEAFRPVEGISQEAYDALVAQTSDASTREIAAQTASILAFDYLTNNFARFDRASTDFDHAVLVRDGTLYSIDNLDTWRPRASTRVKGRFSWTRRFNRTSVDSLRALDRDTLSPLLFPNPSGAEKTALRVFWSQRDRLVERVDSLVKSNGEAEVYFE